DEEEGQEVGIGDVLRRLYVERIEREEETAHEPHLASSEPRAEPEREEYRDRASQHACEAREQEALIHVRREEIGEVRRAPARMRQSPPGLERELADEREVEAEGGPAARVRVQVEGPAASAPHHPGTAHGGAVRLLDHGVVEDVDLEGGVGKAVGDPPEADRDGERHEQERETV